MTAILGVPDHARDEWEELHEQILATGPTPCTGPSRNDWLGTTAQQARASAACFDCPAIEACAQYAATAGEQLGVWGGRTATERRQRAKEPP